jgi:hypothetical protein
VDLLQADLTDLDPNFGRFTLSEMMLSLPAGDALSLAPAPGRSLQTTNLINQAGSIGDFSAIAEREDRPDAPIEGNTYFSEDIRINDGDTATFSDPNLLVLDDLIANVLGSRLTYSYGLQIFTVSPRSGNLVTGTQSFRSISATVNEASATAVPLPASGPLILVAFGELALLRRRRTSRR